MSQIEDLQARITRALDRIGQGIDGLEPGPAQSHFDALRGRAEAAEEALAETQEALAASREQAEVDRDAAVAAARAEAAEELERALAEAQAAAPAESPPAEAGPSAEADVDLGALQEALEDEKMANAQLEERLRVLHERLTEAEAAEPAQASPESMAALDAELQKLRTANQDLMAANAALREANAQGVGDAELINRGLQAELDALRAARAADAAEAEAVLGALIPLLAGADDEEAQG